MGTACNGPGPWPPASLGGAFHAATAGFTAAVGAVSGRREDGEAGTGAPGMTEAARPPKPPTSAPVTVAANGVRPTPGKGTHALVPRGAACHGGGGRCGGPTVPLVGATAPRAAAPCGAPHGCALDEAAGGGITVHTAGLGGGPGGPRAAAGTQAPNCCGAAAATANAAPVGAVAGRAAARWPPGGRPGPVTRSQETPSGENRADSTRRDRIEAGQAASLSIGRKKQGRANLRPRAPPLRRGRHRSWSNARPPRTFGERHRRHNRRGSASHQW